MAPNNFEFDFEQISFNPLESVYINETDIKNVLYETQGFENISVLHVNLRGLKTNFENFCNLLNNTGSSFGILCLTETWCSNSERINSSCFDLNNYKAIPFKRKTNKRGGLLL